MLRNLWAKLTGSPASAERREEQLEEMSPDERRFAEESVDDIAADAFTKEHLGGFDPMPPSAED